MFRKIYIFAAQYILSGVRTRLLVVMGIFCALPLHTYGSVPPLGVLMHPDIFRYEYVLPGKDRTVFIFCPINKFICMQYTEKHCLSGQIVSRQNTSAHETCKSFHFDHGVIVEVVLIDGKPWFVATDVCRALGLVNSRDRVVKSLDDDEHLPYQINRAGQRLWVNLITESGLYALVVRSTKPNAKKFRKWVTSEVLPAIRETGSYALTARMVAKDAEIAAMERSLRLLQSSNKTLRGMVEFYKSLEQTSSRGFDVLLDLVSKKLK